MRIFGQREFYVRWVFLAKLQLLVKENLYLHTYIFCGGTYFSVHTAMDEIKPFKGACTAEVFVKQNF